MTVLIFGVQQTIKEVELASERAKQLYVEGAIYEAELIMTESQREVPVDTGRLKNSKFINHNVDKDGVVSTLGYRAEYAVLVHELPPSRVVHVNGKWKYLEDPLKARIGGMQARITDYVARGMR